MLADRHTNRQTNKQTHKYTETLLAILRTPLGDEVNINFAINKTFKNR